MNQATDFRANDAIHIPAKPVVHRDDEYDPAGFDVLRRMQEEHFWYRGRHRFLLHAVRRFAPVLPLGARPLRVVDLGGGCGGWASYFYPRTPAPIAELALADSSARALELAEPVLPAGVSRYQVRQPASGDWKPFHDARWLSRPERSTMTGVARVEEDARGSASA
jgi:hypothetical protein